MAQLAIVIFWHSNMKHQSIEEVRTALETQSFLSMIGAVEQKSVEDEVDFVG